MINLRLGLAVALFVSSAVALATPAPMELTVQGRLLDATDSPVDGPLDVKFSIYDVADDPDPTQPVGALWSATYHVQLTAGVFAVELGDTSAGGAALDPSIFADGQVRWLGVSIAGGAELQPRQRIGEVPAARFADSAGDAQTIAGHSLDDLDARYAMIQTASLEPQPGSLALGGTITAQKFVGDGSGLTNVPVTALAGDLPAPESFTGTIAGDITGTQDATVVTALQGAPVATTAPAAGQTLTWNGSAWTPTTPTFPDTTPAPGSITNGMLASSELTVVAGAGLSGGGLVELGGTTTLGLDFSLLDARYAPISSSGGGDTGGTGGGVDGGVLTLTATTGDCTTPGTVRWSGTTFEGCTAHGWANLLGATPTIASVRPALGPSAGGNLVLISGYAFTAPVSVTFDGVPATTVTRVDDQNLHVVAPAHALGVVDLDVTNGDNRTAHLAGGYDYVDGYFPDLSGRTVLYVSPVGDDVTGNGSATNPYATLKAAIDAAGTTGYAIKVLPGTYRLAPMSSDTTATEGVWDENKDLLIVGSNAASVMKFYASDDTSHRDASLMRLANPATQVTNIAFEYAPNRGTNYSNAIFNWTVGTVRNISVTNIGSAAWSFNYDGTALKVFSSIFDANGHSTGDYEGSTSSYTDCLFSIKPSPGTFDDVVVRAPTDDDYSSGTLPADLAHQGDPGIVNPDGTRSSIGVGGGPFAWP